MVLRATRQYVEALGTNAGKARVGRQYVEVLGPVGSNDVTASASDTLTLSETVTGAFSKELADTLELAETIEYGFIRVVEVTDDLGLQENAEWAGPKFLEVQHNLSLTESSNGHLGVVNVHVSDSLTLSERAGTTYHFSVSDVLSLSQNPDRLRYPVRDTLTLSESVATGKGRDVSHRLAIAQTLAYDAIFTRAVEENLGLKHSGTYLLVGPNCTERAYRPFVGFSTDTETSPPSVTPPSLGAATLTLTYPFDTPTLSLTLRNPEFGNKDSLTFTRINRESRGGTLIIYADPTWPKTQTLFVEVHAMRPQQVEELFTFFAESLGREIGLTDHEGRQWRGIVTDPDTSVSNPERGDRSVSFTFEGELV